LAVEITSLAENVKIDDKEVPKMADEHKPNKIMTQPLPEILQELQASINDAKSAAKEAREAADEAKAAGKSITRDFIRKILASKEFLALMIVTILGTLVAAIAISVGLSLIK
jgi:hypothetical protein